MKRIRKPLTTRMLTVKLQMLEFCKLWMTSSTRTWKHPQSLRRIFGWGSFLYRRCMVIHLSRSLSDGCLKITNLSKKVFHSPTIREELHKLCTEDGLKEQVLLCSVPTRWNSVAEMLGRALTLRSVLNDLCDKSQFNKRDGVRLRRYTLADNEWLLLEQLYSFLDVRQYFVTFSSFSECFTSSSFSLLPKKSRQARLPVFIKSFLLSTN